MLRDTQSAPGTAIRLLLALLLSSGAFATSQAAGLRAGAARSCITPALGTRMNGGLGPNIARRVHDDLWVRALVLDDGATRLAIAVADTCLLDRPVFDEAKRLLVDDPGLTAENILLACTHTHSAGAGCGVHLTEADEPYRRSLPGRIADAVRGAVHHLAPARLGWGSGRVPQHVFCRRLRVKPGVVYTNQLGFTNELAKMNWDSPHPADDEPTGPVDPEVFVVSVRHADGRPLALLANYSLHYVGDVPAGDVSADYFGMFADRIQELLGADRQDPPFVAMMSNGTSGDVNNINPQTGFQSPAPYGRIRRVAEDVAQEALRVVQGVKHRGDLRLAAALAECHVITRRPGAEELAAVRKLLAGRAEGELGSWPENYAREQILLAGWPETVSLPMQVLRIGELAVAAWPGEIFAATGLDLKRRRPARTLFNVSLANGWFGYIPPPEQFVFGAYETWRMRTCPLATNAIPQMTAVLLDLLSRSSPSSASTGP
jgi:hypothetical protein